MDVNMKQILVIMVVLILLVIPGVSANTTQTLSPEKPISNQTISITTEIGEKYIQWKFTSVNRSEPIPPLDIYVDDRFIPSARNYTSSTYLMADLLPGERHNIRLYNASSVYDSNITEFLAKATAKTSNSGYEVMYLLALNLIIVVLVLILKDLKYLILLSVFNIGISLLGMSLTGSGLTYYIFIGMAILTGIMLLVTGIPQIREEIDWF
jgi:hypothetical protein